MNVRNQVGAFAHEHHLDDVVLTRTFAQICRMWARRLAIVAVAVFVLALTALGIPESPEAAPWEEVAALTSLTLAVTGLLIARGWEGVGGSIAFIGGVAAGVVAALEYNPLVALGAALVFVFPSVLYLLAWYRTQTLLSVLILAAVVVAVMAIGGTVALGVYDAGFGATHPDSAAAPVAGSEIDWVLSGAVTDSSATIVVKVSSGELGRLAVSESADLADPRWFETATAESPLRFVVGGLAPGTQYHYGVEVAGTLDPLRGTFTTFVDGPMSFTLAFGGCARMGSNGAVYDAIAAENPDLFLALGDWYYADIYEDSIDAFREAYDQMLAQPGQAALYRSVPIVYVWDDHDYGPNDSNRESPARAAAKAAYLENVPHYPLALTGEDDPIAQAFTVGRVRFIVVDGRTDRDPQSAVDGPDKTMLGVEQVEWLKAELLDAADRYAVVVLTSNVPWIAPAEAGADHWGGYAYERQVIADFLVDQRITNVLMLAGDAHMVAIDDGTNTNYADDGDGFPLMHAAALDRVGSSKGGPYSHGLFPGGGQYGVVEFVDDGSTVTVLLSGRTWDGQELTRLTVEYPAGGAS